MTELREYVVTIGGIKHTLLLDEANAERLNAVPVQAKQHVPANKQRRTVANKRG